MKTLKQIYRQHGYEVNTDNQKGIGNLCITNIQKCFIEWLTEKRKEQTILWRTTNSPIIRDSHYWKEEELLSLLEEIEQ